MLFIIGKDVLRTLPIIYDWVFPASDERPLVANLFHGNLYQWLMHGCVLHNSMLGGDSSLKFQRDIRCWKAGQQAFSMSYQIK